MLRGLKEYGEKFPQRMVLGLLGIIFCLSLGYSLAYRIVPAVDAQAYDAIARNLLNGCGFKEVCTNSFSADTAIVRAGPGYEFFLAGVYAVFGYRYEAVWGIQALLHTVTAGLLYLIARRIFVGTEGKWAGLLAALFFGLWPDLIEINAMLLTETLYLFLVTLVWYVFIRNIQNEKQLSWPIFLGLITGVTILTRPPVVLFSAIFVLYYLVSRRYRAGFLFVSSLLLALLPWGLSNLGVYHQFILTTLIGDYNLWVGNTLLATGGQIAGGFNPATSYAELNGFLGFSDMAKKEFWQFVTLHPMVFIKLTVLRFIRFFSLIRPMGFWFYQSGLKQALFVVSSGVWIAVVFVGGFTGLFQLAKERKNLFYYFLLLALSAPVLLLPTVVQSRYRFQIYPFLALGVGWLAAVYSTKRFAGVKNILLPVSFFFVIVTLLDGIIFLPIIIERLQRF